jgi:hypothetical protein
MKTKQKTNRDPGLTRTEVPGQNPKADDAPDHDVHHDESRSNRSPKEAEKERTPKGENL